jgi:hypothetical protein
VKSHSIFKNFDTTSPNAMKPGRCTPLLLEIIPKRPRTQSEASGFHGGTHKYKTNKLPCFIDMREREREREKLVYLFNFGD